MFEQIFAWGQRLGQAVQAGVAAFQKERQRQAQALLTEADAIRGEVDQEGQDAETRRVAASSPPAVTAPAGAPSPAAPVLPPTPPSAPPPPPPVPGTPPAPGQILGGGAAPEPRPRVVTPTYAPRLTPEPPRGKPEEKP